MTGYRTQRTKESEYGSIDGAMSGSILTHSMASTL